MRRVGILGGTFDPVHYGHLVIAEEVYAALKLAEMVFVPSGQPPHKLNEVITAAEHRLAMLELAIASNPHFSISLVELDRPGPSYTVDTLRLLRKQWGEQTERLLVVEAPQLDISSTDLRLRVAEGRPIKYQTPESVEQYIRQYGLYRQKFEGSERERVHGTNAT